MYNTDFVVRYNDIETELIEKIMQRPDKSESKKDDKDTVLLCKTCLQEGDKEEEEEEEEYEYTIQDVQLICEKLYRDELLSVFDVETVTDKKMDLGIRWVIDKMINNTTFRVILEEIKNELVDINLLTGTPTEIDNMIKNLEYLIFVTLFNQQVFHIAHKCICQLFTVGTIDPEYVLKLKQKLVEFFNR